jgi:hypothetical protein
MAGLLDYYKEHPELWEENEYLLKKDPAYNLGMMDLGIMSFQDRPGGKIAEASSGFGRFMDNLTYMFGRTPRYEPKGGTLGAYLHPDAAYEKASSDYPGLTRGNIALYTEPFTEGDTPTQWIDPKLVPPDERTSQPLYNIDKARVMSHENRHRLMYENPELYNLQPDWTALNVQSDDPDQPDWFNRWFNEPTRAERKASKNVRWRNEAFNRFMDYRYFPDWGWRSNRPHKYPQEYPKGLSSKNLKPTDMYFDKIWKEHWEPYAEKYEKTLEKIAARQNVPGTPIVPMDRGRGRDDSPGGGYGQSPTGRDIAGTPFSEGGLATMFERKQ